MLEWKLAIIILTNLRIAKCSAALFHVQQIFLIFSLVHNKFSFGEQSAKTVKRVC